VDCESHKVCSACGELKPLASFLPTRFSDDGHAAKCRPCLFAAAREVCRQRDRRIAEHNVSATLQRPTALGVRR